MAKSIEGRSKNGLRYYILPQGIFEEKMAAVLVKRGANALDWEDAQGRRLSFPQGTAHFIEHKLFQQKWGDAFLRLTQNGASANAFTDAEKTVYYFSCRRGFAENLRILLDFVQHPYFTEQATEQEKDIILSEITMYEDDPDWKAYFQMLEGMYAAHPVKNQIAGTAQSVREITAETLQRAYETYYTTDSMALVCTGNVPVREILRMIGMVKGRESAFRPIPPTEPAEIQEKYREKQMGLRTPCFQIGWKLPPEQEQSRRRRILMGMLTELLAGESSDLFQRAYEQGWLDEPLGGAYLNGSGYAFAAFSGRSEQPEEVAEGLCAQIERMHREGIAEDDFRRICRKMLGRFLRRLDSVEALCMGQIEWAMTDTPLHEVLRQIKELRREDAEDALRLFSRERMVLSVVR